MTRPGKSELAEKITRGDRLSLARGITLVENQDPTAEALLNQVYSKVGPAYRIGVTGPPGAGKSTLIDVLVHSFRVRGKSVGVVAIDPSSPVTGGSVLGDRVRLNRVAGDEKVFFRSMASRGSAGGLALAAQQAADLFDAAGFEVVILETVGVGQLELDIAESADTILLVLQPDTGDSVQVMKAGILEVADLIAVNKADHAGAEVLYNDLKQLRTLKRVEEWDWQARVVKTSATNASGIKELVNELEAHWRFLQHQGRLQQRRLQRIRRMAVKIAGLKLQAMLQEQLAEGGLPEIELKNGGCPSPFAVAEEMMSRFMESVSKMKRGKNKPKTD